MEIGHHFNPEIISRITARQVDLLYSHQPVAMFSTMFVITLLFGFLYSPEITGRLALIYLLFWVVITCRVYLSWRYFRDRRNDCVDSVMANRLYLAGIIASGLSWSITIVALFPVIDLADQILLLIVVMGFSAAAHTTLGFKKTPIISFVFLLTVPLVFAVHHSQLPNVIAITIAIIFHAIFMLRSSLMFYSSTYTMLGSTEIAKLREQELELQTTEANLANQAKSEFLSRMSHELRTPLNAVLGMNELLIRDSSEPLSDKQTYRVHKIDEAGRHLLSIVDDVLDLSRIEVGSMEVSLAITDCQSIINESIKLVENKASIKNITIIDEMSLQDACVFADAKRLKQVIVNLLDNAVKYNKREGQVTIILNDTKDNFIRISIVDTGYGIPKESMNKLFIPFSRLNTEHLDVDGTGIGLSLCKQLVELMDGSIGVESQPGKGCCFWVEIPQAKAGIIQESSVVSNNFPDVARNTSSNNRILLVEDNQVNREVAIDMLEELGYEVDVAVNGKQAVDILAKARYAIVLMDCEMPVMDGFTATETIRAREKQFELEPTTIVALTAHAITGAKERCIASGMDDFLSKPFSMSTLQLKLKQRISRSSEGETADTHDDRKQVQAVDIQDAGIEADDNVIDQAIINRLNTRKNGDTSLTGKIVNVYLEQSSKLLDDLTSASEHDDVEAVRSISHALKSSSINVGAIGLSDLCKQVELHCGQGEIEMSLVAQVKSTYSDVERALNTVLHNNN